VWSGEIREMLRGENKSLIGAKSDQGNMGLLGRNKVREALDSPQSVNLSQAVFSPTLVTG
jgi:hypothetical protein